MHTEHQNPVLNQVQIRVLGSLIEKSKTTPDYYPMSLNAITAACNQKSSRKPVVEYDEQTVSSALSSLKAQSLVATAVGGGSRTIKYKHNFTTVFPLSEAELAILCLLFLRGPQTPGELNTNSGRLHEFKSLESVLETLQGLSNGTQAFVKEYPRRAGQKETRYIHLLSDTPPDMSAEQEEDVSTKNQNDLEERLQKVETELSELKVQVQQLLKELLG